MSRFFYEANQKTGDTVILQGEDVHHLTRVLRMQTDDLLELCGPGGICHLAEITAVAKDQVCCRLLEMLPGSEPQAKVDLAFGLLKGEKTDFVLQKGTELGVSAFLPFLSSRTVVKVQKDKDSKQKRRQRIVRSAAGQTRRSLLPAVREAVSFDELLQRFAEYELVLFFWEEAAGESSPLQLREEIGRCRRLLVVTGPEGGFSAEEAGKARKAGAKLFTLGPRILRAETAAVVAAALCLYEAGDLGG